MNCRIRLANSSAIYMLNGYTFEYGDEIRALLHRFATAESDVDVATAVVYFRACARRNGYMGSGMNNSTQMASSSDSTTPVDDEVRRLYERYQSAETEAERREIALEMGELDGRRHAIIYERLETE